MNILTDEQKAGYWRHGKSPIFGGYYDVDGLLKAQVRETLKMVGEHVVELRVLNKETDEYVDTTYFIIDKTEWEALNQSGEE